MSKGPLHGVRPSVLRRTIRGVTSAGLQVGRIEVAPDGRVVIMPKDATTIEAHPTDNRMILISLTPAGVDMIERLAPIAWERQKRLLSGLSQRDAFRVVEILERTAEDLLRNP